MLKSILGITKSLKGSVELGDYLDVGYFEQESSRDNYRYNYELSYARALALVKYWSENDIKFELKGRVKSIYSLYNKMYNQQKKFDDIYDFYALRIIVDTELECYTALGLIHEMFNSIPGRFKDYISTPKPNMYQSLHTTVIGPKGYPFEVQIRTWDMHHTAEFGIAAHWKYKLGLNGTAKFEERLAWIRQLLDAQKEADDVKDIVRTIKSKQPDAKFFFMTIPYNNTLPAERIAREDELAEAIRKFADKTKNCYVLDFRKYAPVHDQKFNDTCLPFCIILIVRPGNSLNVKARDVAKPFTLPMLFPPAFLNTVIILL